MNSTPRDFARLGTELAKFAVVGIAATLTHALVYLGVLALAVSGPQLANLAGFLVAVVVSYLGQRRWTFAANRVGNEQAAKIRFAISSLLSLAMNAFWVFVTVHGLSLPPEYSVIGILFLTPAAIFVVLKFWVFA